MNGYNPNAYSAGYPYQQYPNYPSYMAQNPQIQQPQQMPYATGLNGKIVDSEDMVRATEVPIGGYGIFPKADLSEIYIKTWNSNGTTQIVTFKPFLQIEDKTQKTDFSETLMNRIDSLENKIDEYFKGVRNTPIKQTMNKEDKKVNEY